MIYKAPEDIIIDNIFLDVPDFIKDVRVVAKLEQFNMGGSIKVKAAVGLISHYESTGQLKKGTKIVESSSGNMGVALSMVCKSKGYPFICVTDPNASKTNISLMRSYGARVIMAERGGDGGFVQNRLRIIQSLKEEDPNVLWVDQYSSEANWKAHYATTAKSLFQELLHVDYLFIGVGSGGTIMGCRRYIDDHKLPTKLIAVDPEGSVLSGGKSMSRYIPGIGGSVIPSVFKPEAVDDFVRVDEKNTVRLCRHFARTRGWLLGGSTGTALQAIRQYASNIEKGATVAFISPDFGVNYLNSIYDPEWTQQYLEV